MIVLSDPMVTSPVSYTDEISRRLATGTFQRLPELYEDYRVGAEDVYVYRPALYALGQGRDKLKQCARTWRKQ